MSKASQRRQAAQQKRRAEIRGSPEKRLRQLFDESVFWQDPAGFWRACVKHLPPDPSVPSSIVLAQAIEYGKPLIEKAAAGWVSQFADYGDDVDEILPGVLMPMMLDPVRGPRFACLPLSVFGRAIREDVDLRAVILGALPPECEAGLWFFGSVVTGRGETYVLGAHRDGAITASVRVAGQWVDGVPSITAGTTAHTTAAFMMDERSVEAVALVEALGEPDEDWADPEKRALLLRQVTSDAQTPYLNAMWRVALNQLVTDRADSAVDEMRAFAKEIMAEHRSKKRGSAEPELIRAQLEASKAREADLSKQLKAILAGQASARDATAAPPATSAAQRLAGIF